MKNRWFKYPKIKIERLSADPEHLVFGSVRTMFGEIFLAYSHESLVEFLIKIDGVEYENSLKNRYPASMCEKNDLKVKNFFENLIENEKNIKLALKGTSFQYSVWEALLKIEPSTTVSYSDVSKTIENPKAVRAAANAVGANPVIYLIPCHRVIAKDGSLGGFSCGLDKKKAFLRYDRQI